MVLHMRVFEHIDPVTFFILDILKKIYSKMPFITVFEHTTETKNCNGVDVFLYGLQ